MWDAFSGRGAFLYGGLQEAKVHLHRHSYTQSPNTSWTEYLLGQRSDLWDGDVGLEPLYLDVVGLDGQLRLSAGGQGGGVRLGQLLLRLGRLTLWTHSVSRWQVCGAPVEPGGWIRTDSATVDLLI